ncbi:chorismate mutase [Mycobacterium arosiense]|uniref:Chorismate mutase n=1 Tax=Mycobacterium arosiense ATCC BAA-1401 = DSM 45069 TaxID=1265311 RepID=A0A1W9Z739_MYCAI|nr:chorismate mutase [Mycobacterium arosiense]ORA08270.1 chorismate mutase [Mycobacterium arosiense ATCC BAA-1401 = DSM 45069]
MHPSVHSRSRAVAACCGAAVVSLALAVAPARAHTSSPLSPLADAAAQRLQIADPVAAYKWHQRGAIEDPARVQQELTRLADDAVGEHIDRDYVTRVFGDQISATEAIEYHRFADWKLNPASAPPDAPDLSSSRSAIDALNRRILTQLSANWGLLHSSECAAQLDAARSGVIQERQLDDLYQRALSSATQSYCQQ